jgi:hypothetical protein
LGDVAIASAGLGLRISGVEAGAVRDCPQFGQRTVSPARCEGARSNRRHDGQRSSMGIRWCFTRSAAATECLSYRLSRLKAARHQRSRIRLSHDGRTRSRIVLYAVSGCNPRRSRRLSKRRIGERTAAGCREVAYASAADCRTLGKWPFVASCEKRRRTWQGRSFQSLGLAVACRHGRGPDVCRHYGFVCDGNGVG